MNVLWYAGAFLLALAPLIVVHEFGHYLVARWCGVMVLRFSVGFGKPLISRRWGRDGTEWSIAAVPFGGYVKMLDEREATVALHLQHRAFNRQPVFKRMAIVLAGPMANLLLATAIYCGIFMTGVSDLKPLLGNPAAKSSAALAGIQSGELVEKVNDEPILSWTELRKSLINAVLDKRRVVMATVTRDGRPMERILKTSLDSADLEGDPAEILGLSPFRPNMDAVIGGVTPHSPADQAGLLAGDVIVAIDGEMISDWSRVVELVRPAYGRRLSIEISREGVRRQYQVVPNRVNENGQMVGRLGVAVKTDPARYARMTVLVRYSPAQAAGHAVSEVWDTSVLSLRMIGRMITGQISLKNLSGPVTIADYAGQSAKMGASSYLRFIALISISLGVLNLLPVPVLDGGHLMYYLAELFKGSPLSDRVLEFGHKIGFGLLGLLMLLAFYNDIHRLIAG